MDFEVRFKNINSARRHNAVVKTSVYFLTEKNVSRT